ncbi:MAG: hypothetical protein AAGK78_04015 [Planctomycetota bacterium]
MSDLAPVSADTPATRPTPAADVVLFQGTEQSLRKPLLTAAAGAGIVGLLMIRPNVILGFGLLILSAVFATLALVLRRKSCEINLKGLVLRNGRDQWGDVHFVPWKHVTHLGGRPKRDGSVRLYFRQRGMPGRDLLPGGLLEAAAYVSLLERIASAVGDKHPNLRLGNNP